MKRTLWIGIFGAFLMATQAHAVSMSEFELYGKAPKGSDVAALWKGEVMAESEADNGRFQLDVPMGSYMPYHKGDKLQIAIDDKPTGQTVTIGGAGTSRQMALKTK